MEIIIFNRKPRNNYCFYHPKIDKPQKAYGLKLGDKLLQVNGVIVENQQDVIENISDFKEFPYLLFERDDFQFFIRVN